MAANGGTVTFLWGRVDGITVSITGSGVYKVDGTGSAITFPQTINANTNYVCPTDDTITVTASYYGRVIFTGTYFLASGNHVILNLEPKHGTVEDALAPVTSTTAALAAVGNAINTVAKYTGKCVWNVTTSKPVYANGPLAADLWKDSAAATAHTPV